MTEPAKAQTIDTEIVRHCAFSLPAVTLTLGRKNWPCLRDTYELLIADMQVQFCIVRFQKISILPPQKGLEFPGGWGL